MKFYPLLVAFCLLKRGASQSLRHSSDKEDRKLLIAWGDPCNPDGCLEVKDGCVDIGNSFTLGDCSVRENGVDMIDMKYSCGTETIRDDDNNPLVLVQTRLDPTKCMQAQNEGTPIDGGWMRVQPCNPDNRLQRFYFDLETQVLRLEHTDLCVTYHGNVPNINKDHMQLRDCDSVHFEWSDD